MTKLSCAHFTVLRRALCAFLAISARSLCAMSLPSHSWWLGEEGHERRCRPRAPHPQERGCDGGGVWGRRFFCGVSVAAAFAAASLAALAAQAAFAAAAAAAFAFGSYYGRRGGPRLAKS